MKKVLLYCLRSVRSEVEQFLSDDYNIIGYSDSDSHYIHVKEFEYKPFYQPDELYKVDLDYIIICHTNREISEIIAKKLVESGIKRNQIIKYAFFNNIVFFSPYERFAETSGDFYGLIFGMSHSMYGIETHFLNKRFYKFSVPSVDLFYQYHLLTNIWHRYSKRIGCVKEIILEIPFYIFNFDCSMSRNIFTTYINFYEEISDFHHYNDADMISMYQRYKDMFKSKKERNSSSLSNNYTVRTKNMSEQEIREYKTRVFCSFYEDTIEENKALFQKIISILNQMFHSPSISIVVPPMNPLFMNSNLNEINRTKSLFLNCIQPYINQFKYYDFSELYKDNPDFFCDATHLNTNGSDDFSKFLNKYIGQS